MLHVRFRLSSLKHSQISVQAHICLCFETGLIHKNRGHPTTKFRCPLNNVQLKILHPTVYPPFRSHLSCCRIFQPFSFYFRRSFLPATSLYWFLLSADASCKPSEINDHGSCYLISLKRYPSGLSSIPHSLSRKEIPPWALPTLDPSTPQIRHILLYAQLQILWIL